MDDDTLLRGFLGRDLPASAWTHEAHLRVGYLHLRRYDLAEAHLRLRAGIILLNSVHGLVEGPTRGYSETLTWLWLVLLRAAMRAAGVPLAAPDAPAPSSLDFLDRATALRLRELVHRHYTPEHLNSPTARARLCAPDREPLPE